MIKQYRWKKKYTSLIIFQIEENLDFRDWARLDGANKVPTSSVC